ncbi:DUF6624 domain-containing protein [Larkinella rosea]|uniref:Tetratricopeptide repeat protein n=1 Tax=Larkinella rosea TaxID=2025312 RepID=A0A3P1BUA1_9BACT|nr:DUF6624 domain-containing protein [Larkinella rosea]RRB04681.1 hypothetical protein EHT25_14520 [Larkinella rosea]
MRFTLLVLAFLYQSLTYAQTYKSLISEAEKKYNEKAYPRSVELYQRAFKLEQKNRADFYNAACSAALMKDTKLAFNWLNRAIEKGYINIRHMKTDSDLNILHGRTEWNELVARLQTKVDKIEANYDKPLQARLLAIYDDDQKYRKQIDSVSQKYGFDSREMKSHWKTIGQKDSINLVQVKAILDEYGWLGEDKVGSQANMTLFLVIQHADLATQQKYLPLMREAVKAKKAEPSSLAMLEDRVALGEGRRQTYGSQIGQDPDGKAYVLPLNDPDNVDKRRAEVGLPPLADYVKYWDLKWDVADYKKRLPEYEKKTEIK